MFTVLLLAGSLVPLATMVACLFGAAWLRQAREAPSAPVPARRERR